MGMMIDNSCEPKSMSKEEIVDTLKTMVFGVQAFERFNAKERETLDKAWNLIDQHETRLKTDMVVMLEELQLEINEAEMHRYDDQLDKAFNLGLHKGGQLIQQKINALQESEG